MHTGTPVEYHEGQQVLLSNKHFASKPGYRKLDHKWIGPFTVTRVINKGTQTVAVELQLPSTYNMHNVVNVSQVKPFHVHLTAPAPTPPKVVHFEVP